MTSRFEEFGALRRVARRDPVILCIFCQGFGTQLPGQGVNPSEVMVSGVGVLEKTRMQGFFQSRCQSYLASPS